MSGQIIVNVDDNEPARYARNRLLRHAGFEVFDAGSGQQALKLIAEKLPELVLLDVNLPDMNGIEVCRTIKSQADSASVLVLQISATATAATHATAALNSGADTYLAEPVDPDVLVATVRALLRLRTAERELLASNAALRDANLRLESLNQALSRSNRDLEQFAHIASHDLQEPLRTISAYMQLLTRSLANTIDDKQRNYMEFIVESVRRMGALIDDLLAFSSVGSGNLEFSPVSLTDAVGWALENLRDKIKATGAVVTQADLPTVLGDRLQLAQVFQNLIGNSIKYRHGDAGPLVHIDAERLPGEEWAVSVRDNGIGIAPEYHERIFIPFKRLHGREIPGTGIGLAVCRRIIENHGGGIWVESQTGQGSTFFVRLKGA